MVIGSPITLIPDIQTKSGFSLNRPLRRFKRRFSLIFMTRTSPSDVLDFPYRSRREFLANATYGGLSPASECRARRTHRHRSKILTYPLLAST